MRLHHVLVSVVALASADVLCQTDSPYLTPIPSLSQTSLCVTTSIGTCGSVCEPFQCMPNYTIASAGETLFFDIHSTPGTPYVLFFGTPVPTCQSVPGLGGELGAWSPLIPFRIGTVSAPVRSVAVPFCHVGHDQTQVPIPESLPAGTDSRFQVLGMNTDRLGGIQIGFSRPTEVRCR